MTAYRIDFILYVGEMRFPTGFSESDAARRVCDSIMKATNLDAQYSFDRSLLKYRFSVPVYDVEDPSQLFVTIAYSLLADEIIFDVAGFRQQTLKILGPLPSRRVRADTIVLAVPELIPVSLSGAEKILDCRILSIPNIRCVKRSVLSLLRSNIQEIDHWPLGSPQDAWVHIVNRHLKGARDILACQEELIDNGFEDYAEL